VEAKAVHADRAYLSYWEDSAPGSSYPALEGEVRCDVAVVGGGIIGVSAALRLAKGGAKVALLEARRIGAGATGYTTAKVSSLHGLTYAELSSSYGDDAARAYGELNEGGLETVAGWIEELGIDCDWRRKPNFTYTEDPEHASELMEEAAAAKRAGLPASFVTDVTELPYDVPAAVRFANQAEFHPLKYLRALAAAAADAGVSVHESTRVVGVSQGDPCTVETDSGAKVRAGHVIVATHLPILDRGLFFARAHPERSYVILARLDTPLFEGMYLSDESPAHSLRAVPTPDGELLMVGGESHKAATADVSERYRNLEFWARERFNVASVDYRWATHDFITNDSLPFIGTVPPHGDRILTATGMKKWGLAMGTGASELLARTALGEEPDFGPFDTRRLHPLAGGPSFAKENAQVGLAFFGDRLRRGSADRLEPGEGGLVGSGLTQRAAYRTDDGTLRELSARCTHLGCLVRFNNAERTWDCPCHGSRFDLDGEVIEGPAVRPLKRYD
jgi:glycine/D-amino acid oxidase-like deaminating enzyme/nitrite reductase/ring-hydroxylating ferredoxin subunit